MKKYLFAFTLAEVLKIFPRPLRERVRVRGFKFAFTLVANRSGFNLTKPCRVHRLMHQNINGVVKTTPYNSTNFSPKGEIKRGTVL